MVVGDANNGEIKQQN